jgi:hypothetical protein
VCEDLISSRSRDRVSLLKSNHTVGKTALVANALVNLFSTIRLDSLQTSADGIVDCDMNPMASTLPGTVRGADIRCLPQINGRLGGVFPCRETS